MGMMFVWGSTIWWNTETRTNGFVCADVSMLLLQSTIMEFAEYQEDRKVYCHVRRWGSHSMQV